MTASAADAAAELRRRDPSLGQVKLHKLLYYCQAHHLAFFDRPLFGENLHAWKMGPVVADLWHAEKDGHPAPPTGAPLGEAELNTIGYTLHRYGALSGNDLTRLSHAETPWGDAWRRAGNGGSDRISTDLIRDFFREEDAAERDPLFDSPQFREWITAPATQFTGPGKIDTAQEIQARIDALTVSA